MNNLQREEFIRVANWYKTMYTDIIQTAIPPITEKEKLHQRRDSSLERTRKEERVCTIGIW